MNIPLKNAGGYRIKCDDKFVPAKQDIATMEILRLKIHIPYIHFLLSTSTISAEKEGARRSRMQMIG